MNNILTVDCEDWFHTAVAQKYMRLNDYVDLEQRVCVNVKLLLDLFDSCNARATFFILGQVAEKFPELIQMIEKRGHSIGAHGYHHKNVAEMTVEEFENEVSKVTCLLRSLARGPVVSFRAPNWSINKKCLWALDVLEKYGYFYDSSMTELTLSATRKGMLIEVPRYNAQVLGIGIPLGGAFLRLLLPLNVTRALVEGINGKKESCMLYVHPWETDRDIPVVRMSVFDHIIQYCGIVNNLKKLQMLLARFAFVSLEEYFEKNNTEHLLGKLYCRL